MSIYDIYSKFEICIDLQYLANWEDSRSDQNSIKRIKSVHNRPTHFKTSHFGWVCIKIWVQETQGPKHPLTDLNYLPTQYGTQLGRLVSQTRRSKSLVGWKTKIWWESDVGVLWFVYRVFQRLLSWFDNESCIALGYPCWRLWSNQQNHIENWISPKLIMIIESVCLLMS